MRAASIITIFAAFTLNGATAQSRDYPFCAYGSKSSEVMRCDYTTLDQCRAAIGGGGGSCIANPRVEPAQTARKGGPAQR